MLYYVRCTKPGESTPALSPAAQHLLEAHGAHIVDLPEIPGRKDVRFLDSLPRTYVTGSTASLSEIAAQPDVAHQGHPQPDPHQVREQVRVVVHGSDASLAALVSKLMRIDALWVQVAFVPSGVAGSTTAKNWGLPLDATADELLRFALESPALPTALIRDDHGLVVLGAAELTGERSAELVGEVIVDSDTLYRHDPEAGQPGTFRHGVRMMPTMGGPGLVAVPLPAPEPPKRTRFFGLRRPRAAEPPVLSGRALQAGGVDLQVTRDGLPHPRALTSVTFYRHLRDGQFVRR